MEEKDNIIIKLTFQFALEIIEYCEVLEESRRFIIANQLLKSGTSIGANIREAQNAESKADFIHKFKISAKEIEETIYWLELCKYSKNYPNVEELLEQISNISRVVNKIIITSKQK
ncbi:MAG: four helix bundle protein [Bacteroidetes bacterium HGW-Bacteroidetes-18]|nr:MAG: four helix bundle protein [Bacteroidetes bacterium HGW-Bacteroidetes-18]